MYRIRACDFENELIAAEAGGLSVGAGVFESRNVDPLVLRKAYVARMTDEPAKDDLQIVQGTNAPNDASLKSH